MIHPEFKNIRDIAVAEAASDIMLPENFRFVVRANAAEVEHWPPEPAEIICGAMTFLFHQQEVPFVRQTYFETQGIEPEDRLAAGTLYEDVVGHYQSYLPDVVDERSTVAHYKSVESVQQYIIDRALDDNRKLVAAHLTGKIIASGALTAAFVYAGVPAEGLALDFRDRAQTAVSQAEHDDLSPEKQILLAAVSANYLQLFAKGLPQLSATYASSLLPTPEQYRSKQNQLS